MSWLSLNVWFKCLLTVVYAESVYIYADVFKPLQLCGAFLKASGQTARAGNREGPLRARSRSCSHHLTHFCPFFRSVVLFCGKAAFPLVLHIDYQPHAASLFWNYEVRSIWAMTQTEFHIVSVCGGVISLDRRSILRVTVPLFWSLERSELFTTTAVRLW